MSDPNLFRDVHVYDNTWEHDFSITTRFTLHDKVDLYQWLIPLSNQWGTNNGRLGLHLVMRDTQKPPNYDPANRVYADDILSELIIQGQKLDLEQQKELVLSIDEQMGDMFILGQCPSGRNTRLIQTYQAFK